MTEHPITIREAADRLGFGYETVRLMVMRHPRIIRKFGPGRADGKRGYCSYRIPLDVLNEILAKLTA